MSCRRTAKLSAGHSRTQNLWLSALHRRFWLKSGLFVFWFCQETGDYSLHPTVRPALLRDQQAKSPGPPQARLPNWSQKSCLRTAGFLHGENVLHLPSAGFAECGAKMFFQDTSPESPT
jgi:hypothetical protein